MTPTGRLCLRPVSNRTLSIMVFHAYYTFGEEFANFVEFYNGYELTEQLLMLSVTFMAFIHTSDK